jgi:hypothetical protein
MKIKIIAIFIIAYFCNAVYGQSENLIMDCGENFRDEIAAVLRQAPFGVKRISKHHLKVNWAKGNLDFIDKPPYDEPLDGTAYFYCGYNSIVGMHLIHKSEDSIFTGVLVDDTTGKITPAGQYVSFSKDKNKYFATVQPDGLDGEEWYVYAKDGKLIWKGLSGITQKNLKYDYEYFVVELSNPRWNLNGELEATGICASERDNAKKKETIVTLKLTEKNWEWLPKISCPGIKGP